ncbi:MAG: hypothetical protein S4CHLAM81_09490 [Chlamydiales bacterium]|nr:hypothetical protein [Chlamydiales bacterium]MCH9635728.1 hypothetical protein [Chlamydiales bacterium]MCH9704294.1 hypothetical protein [Chlamydiota bacterium]
MLRTLLLALAFCALVIAPTWRQDDVGYEALAKSSEPKEMRAYCQQFREGVTKRMWGKQQCQLASDKSELFFFSHDGEVELLEELDAICCLIQEECFERDGKPMQLLRKIEAQKATFNYNSQTLTARDVLIWSYEIPGHTAPQTIECEPIMQGRAQTLTLQLQGKQYDIEAREFQGSML